MDQYILQIMITLGSIIASQGFWQWMQKRSSKKPNLNKMILGMMHDRLLYLTDKVLQRGYITYDEFENIEYLYKPYRAEGGNGIIEANYAKLVLLPRQQYLNKEDIK